MKFNRTNAQKMSVRPNNCFALSLLLLLGCDRRDAPQTYPVTGDVKIDGQPLASGMVIFMSESGRAAKGKLNNGSFQLGTYVDDDGALPGRYKVVIVALDSVKMEGTHGYLDRPVPSLIPARYASTETSGLEFEVAASNSNIADFELVTNTHPNPRRLPNNSLNP